MKYDWMDEYLLHKTGVNKNLQTDWNWQRYCIEEKMLAAICYDWDNNPYYITLKIDPVEGSLLREKYEDIIPGYYMNKTHWISIKPDGEVSDELMKHMLDEAYELVLHGFSKKNKKKF